MIPQSVNQPGSTGQLTTPHQACASADVPAAANPPAAAAPLLVLDTNVCLDLFVFHDPRWERLLLALQQGRVRAVTRLDCKTEWQTVLGYRQLPLDDVSRAAAVAAFDALIACHEFAPVHGIVLPRCSDGDDQKFLELARDAKASCLISKDKALLKLGRKTRQAGLFNILLPQAWLAGYSDGL